jgi:hypothetical protein
MCVYECICVWVYVCMSALVCMSVYVCMNLCKLVSQRNACHFVTVQGVDLNMEPAAEDCTSPCETLPGMRSSSTRDHQISLIESRGPNSRGVHMLRAGLASIGKTYDPLSITTTVPTSLLNAQGANFNMNPLRPSAGRDHQIELIETRGPNSRGVNLLHAELADLASRKEHGPQTVSLLLEGPKHHNQCDGQMICLYPKYARS